jgi:hypothetical protein
VSPDANLPWGRRVSPFMETGILDKMFACIGARLKVADRPPAASLIVGISPICLENQRSNPPPPAF